MREKDGDERESERERECERERERKMIARERVCERDKRRRCEISGQHAQLLINPSPVQCSSTGIMAPRPYLHSHLSLYHLHIRL